MRRPVFFCGPDGISRNTASMTEQSPSGEHPGTYDTAAWKEIVLQYQKPSVPRAVWQLANTLGPLAILWYLMHRFQSQPWWVILPMAVLAGAFLVRIFIVFHDCGHGSYFKSRTANDVVGFLTGLLTFTPYYQWRWSHAIHHASSGDLDKRGVGDLWTMTVQEYLEASPGRRFSYRLSRNPVFLFVVAPLFVFLVKQRFPEKGANKRERYSVYWMNLALLAMATVLSLVFGWKEYLFIQLSALAVAGSAGFWLFYVQHQFDGVYWERGDEWDYTAAALRGSSFYKLPWILQWFSGNIGYHHIHHLNSRIPNYNLERCHEAHRIFQEVKPLTLIGSLKSLTFRLWDEERRKLVGYRHLRDLDSGRRTAGQ